MRTRFVEFCATAVSLVVAGCPFPHDVKPTCDDDIDLCPHSSRTASSVTCDCHCTVGGGDNPANNFDGKFAACLPPALNRMTASDEQRVALDAMESRTFDQRVFNYCSRDVAGFVRLAIKSRARMKLSACLMPVECECRTEGAQRDSYSCRTPCVEVPCTEHNCRSVLRKGSKLQINACACSRTEVCGEVEPPDSEPGICRDWMTSVR
jgi:hypothetical protein